MKRVIISGTPGTGKTSVSKLIIQKLRARMISLNELAISNKLTINYDRKRETSVIDAEKVIEQVKKLIDLYTKENVEFLIIESHFSDIIPNNLIDYAIVLRCHPDELIRRLEKRNYRKEKIFENVQAEILGNCMNYLIEKNLKRDIIEINTTNLKIESVVNIIIDLIQYNKNIEQFTQIKVDWLEELFQENRLKDFF